MFCFTVLVVNPDFKGPAPVETCGLRQGSVIITENKCWAFPSNTCFAQGAGSVMTDRPPTTRLPQNRFPSLGPLYAAFKSLVAQGCLLAFIPQTRPEHLRPGSGCWGGGGLQDGSSWSSQSPRVMQTPEHNLGLKGRA